MNYGIIRRTIGFLLLFETVFFCVPVITALVYREKAVYDFLFTVSIFNKILKIARCPELLIGRNSATPCIIPIIIALINSI